MNYHHHQLLQIGLNYRDCLSLTPLKNFFKNFGQVIQKFIKLIGNIIHQKKKEEEEQLRLQKEEEERKKKEEEEQLRLQKEEEERKKLIIQILNYSN